MVPYLCLCASLRRGHLKKKLPFGYATTVIKFLSNVVYSQLKSLLQKNEN